MTTNPFLDVVFYGPLKAYVSPSTGEIVGIVDKATGASAELLYRSTYLAQARTAILQSWACTADY